MNRFKDDPIFMHKLATLLGAVLGVLIRAVVAHEADKYNTLSEEIIDGDYKVSDTTKD